MQTWDYRAPIPEIPELRIWTALSDAEASALRKLAAGKQVLEIGSAFGFSTLALASTADHVWAVDPHNMPITVGHYNLTPENVYQHRQGTLALLRENLAAARLTDKVTIVQGTSPHAVSLLDWKWDLAFIDGDHSLAAAMADLGACDRALAPGGAIAVHDYGDPQNPDVKTAVDMWLTGSERRFARVDTLAIIR